MNEYPFELTLQVDRILTDMVNLYETNRNVRDGKEFRLAVFNQNDDANEKSVENVSRLLQFLAKKNAISINDSYDYELRGKAPVTYLDKMFTYQDYYYLKILKVAPIKKLLDKPTYAPVDSTLYFKGKAIKIRQNTKHALMCKSLFKDYKSKHHTWEWDEFLEEWDPYNELKNGASVVRSAAIGINNKVHKHTNVNDLLVVTTKTVRINPQYL